MDMTNLNAREAVAFFLDKKSELDVSVFTRAGNNQRLYFNSSVVPNNVFVDFEPSAAMDFFVSVEPAGFSLLRLNGSREWEQAQVRIVISDIKASLALDGAQKLSMLFKYESNRSWAVGNVNVKDVVILDAPEVFYSEPGKVSKAQFRLQIDYVTTNNL